MTTATAAVLEPAGEARIALESVDVQASLQGLFSEVAVTQTYRNLENRNIEAVYTFPLPLDAVLLDLALELNGKILRGIVQSRTKAEDRYEDAIGEGDSAILLQKPEPGLFTLNVGNILPGEQAVVQFRYAQLHRWQGDSLRFHLPTTIAPRYGNPSASELASHQVPEYALTAGHGFSLALRIQGELAQADIDCPSHPVAVATNNGIREISLSGGSALMDRDFVVVVKEPAESLAEGVWAPDNEENAALESFDGQLSLLTSGELEYVALASFHPVFPGGVPESPRWVKLVVDCSGSMSGDSIAQAKAALREIISLLKPNDHFNLITFGSGFELLFPEPVIANGKNIRTAARFVERMDANMGGTRIGAALEAACRCGTAEGLSSDLLLITDGEVWGHEQVVNKVQKWGHRIFSVGVGSAVSEAFVRSIAETTGGACELVSPRENMAERIVRHFRRIDQPKAESVHIEWPQPPVRQIPVDVDALYAGDTLHVLGWFQDSPAGTTVSLEMTFGDGRVVTQEVKFAQGFKGSEKPDVNLPRVAAHTRLLTLDSKKAAELAERYQLVTEYTSCVLVFGREEGEKSEEIPALRKVPHTLAAGWGGTGRVESCFSVPFEQSVYSASEDITYYQKIKDYEEPCLSLPPEKHNEFDRLIAGLNHACSDKYSVRLHIERIHELVAMGLDQSIADQLFVLVSDECDESGIAVCFLAQLLNTDWSKGLSRHVRRLIRKAGKQNTVPTAVADVVSVIIHGELSNVQRKE